MTVTINEYQNNKYYVIIKDSKCEITFKSDSYAQLYFFINNMMKLYNYDSREEKTIYNTFHKPIAKQTIYHSDTNIF